MDRFSGSRSICELDVCLKNTQAILDLVGFELPKGLRQIFEVNEVSAPVFVIQSACAGSGAGVKIHPHGL